LFLALDSVLHHGVELYENQEHLREATEYFAAIQAEDQAKRNSPDGYRRTKQASKPTLSLDDLEL
jgi:hypothetical protein